MKNTVFGTENGKIPETGEGIGGEDRKAAGGKSGSPCSYGPCGEEQRPEDLAEDAAPAYRTDPDRERKYTIEDYYAFDDDIRRELIDGKFFIMEAPSVVHQVILGELYILFRKCAELHDRKCRVLFAPCDVQLNRDRYTMVQPDLFVVCDSEKTQKRVIYGAPDLAVEIMSPSSRSRDAVLKRSKYMQAGVREYWLVDPENRTVTVFLFDGEGREEGSRRYSFRDRIPVTLSGGLCEVDFAVIDRAIEGLEEQRG